MGLSDEKAPGTKTRVLLEFAIQDGRYAIVARHR
jgi:hypothetical protein